VRTALEMQAAIADLDRERGDPEQPLRMRVGVNTGFAIVGGIGHPTRRDYTVIGDTVNVAKRIESFVCVPGQVVIGAATHARLLPGFTCTALPAFTPKGKEHEIQPFRVDGAGA
jgi:class 3 adenylate cyclase